MVEFDNLKEGLDKLVADLRKEYGELRVQANLAKREAVDELHDLERKIRELDAKRKELGSATADASKDIGAAAKLLGEEIRAGFRDIAKRF
jgi:hypothetical protein